MPTLLASKQQKKQHQSKWGLTRKFRWSFFILINTNIPPLNANIPIRDKKLFFITYKINLDMNALNYDEMMSTYNGDLM